MLKTGYVIDERFVEHDMMSGHPERPERLRILLDWMRGYGRKGLVGVDAREATREELLLNHTTEHVDAVAATSGTHHMFDADTFACPQTYHTAVLATGGVLALLDSIVDGRVDNGFALVRPPGHHAESDRVMGFCFFNNIAIGARY